MKMRIRNPAASTDIGSVIQSETARHRYIAVQVATNPPNDVASCPRLRANIGPRNLLVPESIWSICGITAPNPGEDEASSGPVHAPPPVGRSRRKDNAGRRPKRWRRPLGDPRRSPWKRRSPRLRARSACLDSLLHAFPAPHQTERPFRSLLGPTGLGLVEDGRRRNAGKDPVTGRISLPDFGAGRPRWVLRPGKTRPLSEACRDASLPSRGNFVFAGRSLEPSPGARGGNGSAR